MTPLKKATAAILTAAGLAAGGYFYTSRVPADHKVPPERFSGMFFPKGMKITGDPVTHKAGHQIVIIHRDGTREERPCHTIDRDLTGMTEDELKAMVIVHTQREMQEEGIACNDGLPDIFQPAFADSVKRCDECGSDCWLTSCPAHTVTSYCQLTGTSCVITFLCCGSTGCPASCDV